MNSIIIYVVLSCCICICSAGCPFERSSLERSPHTNAVANASPLQRANSLLKTMYANSRNSVLQQTKMVPLIIASGANITLRIGDYRESIVTAAENYTFRKLVSHTAFASFVILEPLVYNQPIDNPVRLDNATSTNVNTYLSLLEEINDSLPTCCNFTRDVLEREQEIVGIGIAFLESVLSNGFITQSQINDFTSAAITLINQNIAEAAISQLNIMHAQVMEWKSRMSEKEWSQLQVIIVGGHMPRGMESRLQYFSRLLNTTMTTGLRIVYAENVKSEEEAIDLLGTHLLDFAVGNAFWNDAEHMHFDILSQATQDYLPILFGESQQNENEL